MSKKPNILCLVSEDCPPRLGAYGDRLARTPNLDALAARGVTFDTANSTSPVCAPSRFSILTGRMAESVPPAQQMTSWGDMPAGIATYPEFMRAAGYYCTNNSKTHYNVDLADPTALWDDCSGTAHWVNGPKDKPFLAIFNCMLTHESCVFEEKPGAVKPGDVTLPAHLPDLPELRQDLASYYNRIAEMDAWMGVRMAEVEAAGLTDETIVIYHSDHASPLPRSKRFCYDDGLQIPLIVHVPEKWRHLLPDDPGSHIATPVSMVDLFRTLAAIIEEEAPEGVQGVPFMGPERLKRTYALAGRDRMDSRYDLTRTLRDERYRYIRNYAPHRPWGQYYAYAWNAAGYRAYETAYLAGDLTKIQERFWNTKPSEELYDMQADPDSVMNLVGDPAHAEHLETMRADLDAQMIAVHDCGFIPERSATEVLPARNDPAIYPIEDVIALANRAIARDPANIPAFMKALADTSAVVRYWGAQGCLMLAVKGHAMPSTLENIIEDERDPDVLIALHEALGHAGHVEASVRTLTALADEQQTLWLRLKALSALAALPLMPEISRSVVACAAEDPSTDLRGTAAYLLHRLDGTYTPETRIFNHALFLKHMKGHSGIGPQSFPDIEDIKVKRNG
ncbi:sulfatase [Rhizobium sp. L1K21]|uniref:sulfatase family protein n=1 Tax=Rhizobium sp. L1K21 TaxID=2954933 RepID=UPI0020931BD0|nr:sulfatase-like hydrolase/transferase [Rhizobium sp. L1K21]MCO6188522.1 sulfatase-like hydrolase/transferase [Rhizobium sp. L1K21]